MESLEGRELLTALQRKWTWGWMAVGRKRKNFRYNNESF